MNEREQSDRMEFLEAMIDVYEVVVEKQIALIRIYMDKCERLMEGGVAQSEE